ncbi:hypothetical protein JTB14_024671 [Gonioctena quinquepunctata]|nr:hypothetical protein JTB14_024671 [Gonioctena quinquepunctata]
MQGFENLLQHPPQPQQFGIEIDNVEVFFVDNKQNSSGGVHVSQTPTFEIDEDLLNFPPDHPARPHDQPPCPTKTPVPHSPWLCHPLCHPAAVFEIADIPLPPPRTTTKLPSPAPAPSDAPSSPLSDPAPPGKPDESWTPDHIIRALQNGERSPELTEALQKLRPPHRPTGRLRYQLRASDGTSMKILLPPCP